MKLLKRYEDGRTPAISIKHIDITKLYAMSIL